MRRIGKKTIRCEINETFFTSKTNIYAINCEATPPPTLRMNMFALANNAFAMRALHRTSRGKLISFCVNFVLQIFDVDIERIIL